MKKTTDRQRYVLVPLHPGDERFMRRQAERYGMTLPRAISFLITGYHAIMDDAQENTLHVVGRGRSERLDIPEWVNGS